MFVCLVINNISGRCIEQYHYQESNDGHSLSRLGLLFSARCASEHLRKDLKIIRKKFFLKIVLDLNGKIFITEMLECGTKMMSILLLLRKHSRIAPPSVSITDSNIELILECFKGTSW